jgi:predicted nucleic acid-binding protein
VIRPLARRDFVLDSGGVSYLAHSQQRAKVWLSHIGATYDEPAILIPLHVLTECITGDPRHDTNVRRLLKKIAAGTGDERHWLHLTPETAERAAVLRTKAMSSGARSVKRPISVVDALVVALAEERSLNCAVTIITSDVLDLQLLVDLTGRTNIAVEGV